MDQEQTLSIPARLFRTMKRLAAIAVYIWVLLTLFALHRAMLMHDGHILYHIGFALLNAMALAKVILIGQELHVGDRFRGRPRLYPILFKSAIFSVLLFAFKVIEESVLGMWRGKGFLESVAALNAALPDSKFMSIIVVCTIMFIALIPFFAFLEIQDAIGADTLRALLFGDAFVARKPAAQAERDASAPGPGPLDKDWYYENAGAVIGPLSAEAMTGLLAQRRIGPDTLVFNAALSSDWIVLSETIFVFGVKPGGASKAQHEKL